MYASVYIASTLVGMAMSQLGSKGSTRVPCEKNGHGPYMTLFMGRFQSAEPVGSYRSRHDGGTFKGISANMRASGT